MKVLSFLLSYSRELVLLAVGMGILSGASSAGILALISESLQRESLERKDLIGAFVALCVVAMATRILSELLMTYLGQTTVYDLRLKMSRKILAVPLSHLERLGAPRLMATLTDDIPAITGVVAVLPVLCVNTAVVIGCLIYIGWLSWKVLLVVVLFMLVGIAAYQLPILRAMALFRQAWERRDLLYKHFETLIRGVKELKLHYRRQRDFLSDALQTTADEYRQFNVRAQAIYTVASSFGQLLVFVVIGALVFEAASLFGLESLSRGELTSYALTLLYLATPLQTILNALPNWSRAETALRRLGETELDLAAHATEAELDSPQERSGWRHLQLKGVTHSYSRGGGEDRVVIGPFDLEFEPGEIVFLTGGNGSGKTTLMKLLVGLYPPEHGEILIDGEPVGLHNLESYRQQFSTVFSEAFLFESFWGLESPQLAERVRTYLEELQLSHAVSFKDGRLSTIELSQGQRKRLALLTAYLEDRPIYLFDEWAADQDPIFKEVFYCEILPELRRRGKTVVAISHDDRFFHLADRMIKLDAGQVTAAPTTVAVNSTERPAALATTASTVSSARAGAAGGNAPSTGPAGVTTRSPSSSGPPVDPARETADPAPAAGPPQEPSLTAAATKIPGLGALRQATAGTVLTLLLILMSGAALSSLAPPAIVPEDAAPSEFSAERAAHHLRAIAQHPRAMGSSEHAQARQYLLDQLRALGVETELQTTTVIRQQWAPWVASATVHNVMARWRGTGDGKAILLMAHYDTVPHSPGAGDDGAGVAALIEALRALRQGAPLRNDVILLLTDAEEIGSHGALAFVQEHRWAADIGLILNFEGRGTEGPSLMFESQAAGSAMISALATVPSARATSLSDEVYRWLPNDTDLSIWSDSDVPGFNFAFIGGESTYHTAQDELARIDLRSLQHHGEYALALTRYFGELDLQTSLDPSITPVYFNLLGSLVSYSGHLVIPLAILLTLATLTLLILGYRRRRLDPIGLLFAITYNLVGAAAIAGSMWLLGQWLIAGYPVFSLWSGWSSLALQLLGSSLLAVAASLASYRWRAHRQQAEDLVAGGLAVLCLLTLVSALVFPGASYLLALPLTLGLLASWRWLVAAERYVRRTDAPISWPTLLSLAALAACIALLWPPVLALLGTALGFLAAPIAGATIFLLLHAALAPHLELEHLSPRRWAPALAFALGLVLLVTPRVASHHDSDNRGQYSLFYAYDTESPEAFWGTLDPRPHPWVEQLIPETDAEPPDTPPYLFFRQQPFLKAAAELPDFDDAEIELLASTPSAAGRRLDLVIRWPYPVNLATILLRSDGELRLVSLDDEALEVGSNFGPGDAPFRRAVRFWAPPEDGIRLSLEIAGGAPLEVETVARLWRLPDLDNLALPEDAMPRPDWSSHASFIRDQVVLEASAPLQVY
ncbi:MAG: cyclic peptide export ABC transporter [Acidobacteriota bacterium]